MCSKGNTRIAESVQFLESYVHSVCGIQQASQMHDLKGKWNLGMMAIEEPNLS